MDSNPPLSHSRWRSVGRLTALAALTVGLLIGVAGTGETAPPDVSSYRETSTSSSTPTKPRPGWRLTTANTGLAALGLACSDLPLYRGNSVVPAGTVIARKRITSQLVLSSGVVIKKSCVQPTTINPGLALLRTKDGIAKPVIIRDSEIDGSLLSDYNAAWTTGFIGVADLYRNYIHDVGSGIGLMGTGEKLNVTVEGNFVRGLTSWGDPRTSGNHSDAFTIRDFTAGETRRSLLVRRNRFNCDSANATGAFFIQTYRGDIVGVRIVGNLLEGQGYQLGLEAAYGHTYRRLHARNNRFSGSGWGPAYVTDGPGWASWEDNFINKVGATGHRGQRVRQP